jgi:3-oxoacyl-[acyl-carrier protein] reductase
MTQKTLDGKLAVVTGGSRGIGKHIALSLCHAGAKVVITGRQADALAAVADELGPACTPYACDQRDPEAISNLAKAVITDLGAPDILVNNAGVFRSGTVVNLALEEWEDVIRTNLTGVFLTTQAFLPAMLERERGDIFLISSMSGKKGDPGAAAYAASKFGLQGFAQALLYEVRKANIRVMVLNPSGVDTGEDTGRKSGPGLPLHAADLAEMLVHLAALPGRTLFRDMDIWGTNP